jgi:hypothetical protein
MKTRSKSDASFLIGFSDSKGTALEPFEKYQIVGILPWSAKIGKLPELLIKLLKIF